MHLINCSDNTFQVLYWRRCHNTRPPAFELRQGALLIRLAFLLAFMLPIQSNASNWQPDSVAVYWARWADTNLLEIPERLTNTGLDYLEPELVGVMLTHPLWLKPSWLHYFYVKQIDSELSLIRHYSGQTHWEAHWALNLQSGPLLPSRFGQLTARTGQGFSFALEEPTFEKGREGIRGEGTHQFQYHMSLELGYSAPQLPRWTVAARLHHRSGVYGLVSPRKTGSNYIGILLRYRTKP